MWFMLVLGWFAILLQLLFVILAVAAGLYYLAELVEEYTVIAGKVIRWIIICSLVIYLCLFLFEPLPLTMIICGVASHIMHILILKTFPYFALTSFPFISAVVLVIINHYLAFTHFANVYYPFTQVLGYFTLCLWIVPFAFFISLSANENVLPTVTESRPLLSDENDLVSHYFSRKGKRYGLLSFFNYAKDSLLPQRLKKSF